MSDLAQLALQRIQGSLPEFPGTTLPEKLSNGAAAARASLLKYRPALTLDLGKARDVMSLVNAWADRNQQALSAAMQSPGASLPKELQLQMGSSERVQDWIIANYTVAVSGMGPWQSGKIAEAIADPSSTISPAWANDDAESRLQAFAMIVKMDNDGDLQRIFVPPAQGTGAFGVASLIVWAIVITVVALAAVTLTYLFLAKRLEVNNKIMADLCAKAQAEGDQATVEKCLQATRDIQMIDPLRTMASEAGKVALLLGGSYLAFRYGIPWIFDRIAGAVSKSKRSPA